MPTVANDTVAEVIGCSLAGVGIFVLIGGAIMYARRAKVLPKPVKLGVKAEEVPTEPADTQAEPITRERGDSEQLANESPSPMETEKIEENIDAPKPDDTNATPMPEEQLNTADPIQSEPQLVVDNTAKGEIQQESEKKTIYVDAND